MELVAIGQNDVEADRPSDHPYWALWKMPDPDEDVLEEFQRAVRDADVYELMDQVNVCGTAGDPAEVLGDMIGT